MTVAGALAGWANALELADIPRPVQHAAARHLSDGVGTTLAARRGGAAEHAVTVARGLGGPPEAVVLGDDHPVGAAAAALGTGVLVHALDFDDTHAEGLVHATAAVLPTAFAVGQQVGASGAEVLVAATVGYEVACRLAAGSPHGFHARGLHATSVVGPLAAAAVAARLMGLSAATTTDALGIAGSSSGGLLEFLATGSSTKQLHPGTAALSGIVAARLAAAGASGPESVVEGSRGIYAALSALPGDTARVLRGLGGPEGHEWETTRITIKPYPACQLMHAALDAAAQLVGDLGDPAAITAVRVEIHPDSAAVVSEPSGAKIHPRTPYAAKFSLPWSLAALLIDGAVTTDTYAPESIDRPELRELVARVHCVAVPGAVPAADAPSRVVIERSGGRSVEAAVDGSRGGPRHPLDDAALRAKFLANAGGSAAAGELADRVLALAEQTSLRRICDLAAAVTIGIRT